MKKFYTLMIAMFTVLIGATSCGGIAVEYGVPLTDSEYGIPLTDYDVADVSDADIVDDSDTPAMEYGPIQTDYDVTDGDVEVPDNAGPEYGVQPVDYDSTDSDVETPDENPDEMTTDYGPISTKFHK